MHHRNYRTLVNNVLGLNDYMMAEIRNVLIALLQFHRSAFRINNPLCMFAVHTFYDSPPVSTVNSTCLQHILLLLSNFLSLLGLFIT